MHLVNWKARRAGGRITINGFTTDGTPCKIVGVDVIEPMAGGCKATDKSGVQHTLGT